MKKFQFFKKYSFLIGLILFAIILSKINLGEIFQNIKLIKPLYLISAILISIPNLFSKAICWNYIKKQQGIKYSLKDSFLMYCSAICIGIFTPGRLGELAKAIYLKKDGHSLGTSLVSVVLDRLSDFVVILIFVFIGSLSLVSVFRGQILTIIIGTMIFVLLIIVVIKIGLIRWFLNIIFRIFVPEKHQKSWQINFQDFINGLRLYKLKHYLIILSITIFSWIFYYLQMYILARGVGVKIPFFYFIASITIAGFVTLLPVSISGIGTRDAVLILLFTPFSLAPEKIVAFSILILSMVLWGALIGLICWFIKPIRV